MAVAARLQQTPSWADDFTRKTTFLTETEKLEQDACVGGLSQTAL